MRQYCLLMLLCGCTTLSNDDLDQLASAQRNASSYFEGGKLNQTLLQVERGLDIEPDDYKLNVLKGASLLRLSERDVTKIDEATEILERVYDWRSPMRHEPAELFYLGLARQRQGLRYLAEAIRVEDRARRAPDKKRHNEFVAQSKTARANAKAQLELANEVFDVLIDRGDSLRLTHNHRMQVSRQLGNDEEFAESAKAFFEITAKQQKFVDEEVKRTPTPDYEAAQYAALKQLEREEVEVRGFVADWCFHQQDYAEALKHMDRALQLDPTRSDNYYNRGRLYIELDEIDKAKADFRRFLATSQLPATSQKMTYATMILTQ
jgi:tetratricopeptide (TPR) repeat protein